MDTTFESLRNHFDSMELHYLSDDGRQSIWSLIQGSLVHYAVQVIVDCPTLQVYGWVPITVPQSCRTDVSEALTRANFGLKLGKFELDFSSGEVRFHACHAMESDALQGETIDRVMTAMLWTLDRYVPAIMSVVFANERPEDAVRRVESGDQTEAAE